MRLGIFGGSFDPVHYGHLLLAETCREACRLDEVWFMPAATAPHKQGQTPTAARARLEMLELALAGSNSLRASRLEIERGGVSYTVDTLRAVQEAQPRAELFLLVGADTLWDVPNWRSPAEICRLATFAVIGRPEALELTGERLAELKESLGESLRIETVHAPLMELSSSEIRERIATGRSIRFRTPRAVEAYIAEHGLYRA